MKDIFTDDIQNAIGRGRSPIPKFSDVLKLSFTASSHTKGYCKFCRRYPQLSHRRTVIDVPRVLVVNAIQEKNLTNSRHLWANRGWLPEEIGILIHSGEIICCEGNELNFYRHHASLMIYELVGLVADIKDLKGQKSHLVSLINGMNPKIDLHSSLS